VEYVDKRNIFQPPTQYLFLDEKRKLSLGKKKAIGQTSSTMD
jgi:hypothetical protein